MPDLKTLSIRREQIPAKTAISCVGEQGTATPDGALAPPTGRRSTVWAVLGRSKRWNDGVEHPVRCRPSAQAGATCNATARRHVRNDAPPGHHDNSCSGQKIRLETLPLLDQAGVQTLPVLMRSTLFAESFDALWHARPALMLAVSLAQ